MAVLCCSAADNVSQQQQQQPSVRMASALDAEAIVEACIDSLRSKDAISFVGIFRIPGNSMEVEDAVRDFGGDLPPSQVLDPLEIETVATLLKRFLRKCDTCLDSPATSKLPAEQLKHKLDPLLLSVIDFLAEIDAHSDVNKMPAHNLATVFAPLYVEPEPGDDVVSFAQNQLAPLISKFAALIQDRTAFLLRRRHQDEEDDDGIVMIRDDDSAATSGEQRQGTRLPRPMPVRGISYNEVVAASVFGDEDPDEEELDESFWSCACGVTG